MTQPKLLENKENLHKGTAQKKKKEAQKRQQRDIKILAEIIRKLSIFEILESPE